MLLDTRLILFTWMAVATVHGAYFSMFGGKPTGGFTVRVRNYTLGAWTWDYFLEPHGCPSVFALSPR
jgi:hypothetical protein